MHEPAAPDPARRDAFEAVVAEVYEPLQRYLARRVSRDDVDELLDDVLLVLWRRPDDIPPDRTLAWSYGVAHRCLANHRRAGARRLRLVERLLVGRDDRPSVAWTSDTEVGLQEALDRLPDLDAEIVRLWAWERLEPREIATVLDMTANAVSVRLHRIQRRLGDELARKDAAPAGHGRDERHEEAGR